jgi:hypothetical protein
MTDGLIALAFGQELAHTFQLALGAVFLLSAAPKLRHPAVFRRTVAEYRLLPRRLTLPVAADLVGGRRRLVGWKRNRDMRPGVQQIKEAGDVR